SAIIVVVGQVATPEPDDGADLLELSALRVIDAALRQELPERILDRLRRSHEHRQVSLEIGLILELRRKPLQTAGDVVFDLLDRHGVPSVVVTVTRLVS